MSALRKKPGSARKHYQMKLSRSGGSATICSNSHDNIHKYSYLKRNYAVKDDKNFGYGATSSVLLARKITINEIENNKEKERKEKDKEKEKNKKEKEKVIIPEGKWVILKRVRVIITEDEKKYIEYIRNKSNIIKKKPWNISINEAEILKRETDNQHRRKCIRRELRVLKRIQHNNIVKMYEDFKDGPYHYISMEFAQGKTLFQYLNLYITLDPHNSRSIPENICKKVFIQLIRAVSYLHKNGFIHRDIKPENILIKNNVYGIGGSRIGDSKHIPHILLCDFGFSTKYDKTGKKLLKESCGSLQYASPEITLGLSYIGPEIDIWSCGAILYLMFYLRFPFELKEQNGGLISMESLIAKYNMLMFPNEIQISRNGVRLVQQMLKFFPEKRIKLHEIFRHPWITNVALIRQSGNGLSDSNSPTTKSKSIFDMPQILCTQSSGGGGFQIPETQSVPFLSHRGDTYISSRLDSARNKENKEKEKLHVNINDLLETYYDKKKNSKSKHKHNKKKERKNKRKIK